MSNETGEPGPFRLFNRRLAGQISWFIPLALMLIPLILIVRRIIPGYPITRLTIFRFVLCLGGFFGLPFPGLIRVFAALVILALFIGRFLGRTLQCMGVIQLDTLRKRIVPFAEARGFLTDEDVFNEIS